jgi:hypothetical protein
MTTFAEKTPWGSLLRDMRGAPMPRDNFSTSPLMVFRGERRKTEFRKMNI